MKSKRQLKKMAILLSALILFQSCITIYKSQSTSLEEAVKLAAKTKIIYNNGKKEKYKNIVLLNQEYYGVKRNEKTNQFPLNKGTISKIKTKDRALSKIANIVLIPVSLTLIFIIGYSGPELGGGLQSPN